jgi:hypothetical protein
MIDRMQLTARQIGNGSKGLLKKKAQKGLKFRIQRMRQAKQASIEIRLLKTYIQYIKEPFAFLGFGIPRKIGVQPSFPN